MPLACRGSANPAPCAATEEWAKLAWLQWHVSDIPLLECCVTFPVDLDQRPQQAVLHDSPIDKSRLQWERIMAQQAVVDSTVQKTQEEFGDIKASLSLDHDHAAMRDRALCSTPSGVIFQSI